MPARPKIDEREFLALLEGGMLPVDIAKQLYVSPSAITKKLAKYRLSPVVQKYMKGRRHDEEPEESGRYTPKKAKYAAARVAGKKPVEAARIAYQCDNPQSAKVIACRLEKDPTVQKAMKDCLLDAGVTNPYRATKIKAIIDDGSLDHQLKGLDMTFKLDGSYAPVKIDTEIDERVLVASIAEKQRQIKEILASLKSLCDGKRPELEAIDVTPPKTPVRAGKPQIQGE